MTRSLTDAKGLCVYATGLMVAGTLDDFAAVVHPDARNREAEAEPPACRGRGPAAIHATALWLRSAYDDLNWEIHDVVADGDLVVLHTTMSGRHARPFVAYGRDGTPAEAFPPTGRTFAVTQTHWYRTSDGLVIEHWANRDDIGQAKQLGWVPPSPGYLLRMRRALRAARRHS
jgi:predicted ester cyclase